MGVVLVFLMFISSSCCFKFNVFVAGFHGGAPSPSPTPVSLPPYHHRHYPVVAPSQPPDHRHRHHYPYAPIPSPVYLPLPPHYAPSHAPVHYAPAPSPIFFPSQPPKSRWPRSFIEVQGVVYCKSCKYPGVDTLVGAKPLVGATIKLSCKNTKYAPVIQTATTDKNGYFRVAAPKTVTSYASNRCKVYLMKSAAYNCSKPSNLHNGITGADLKPAKAYINADKKPVVLYNVGPLAFEPTCRA